MIHIQGFLTANVGNRPKTKCFRVGKMLKSTLSSQTISHGMMEFKSSNKVGLSNRLIDARVIRSSPGST